MPKDKKAQFERKVGNLENTQAHQSSNQPRASIADAFTLGRHPDLGETTDDRKTKRIRRQAPQDSWVEKQAQLRREPAAEKERQRKAAEAAAKRKADADAALQRFRDGKAHRLAALEKLKQMALGQKAQQRLQKTVQNYPGIRDILKHKQPSYFDGALALCWGDEPSLVHFARGRLHRSV